MNDTMRRHAIVLALAFTLAPVYAQQPQSPPLKNWAAPLYWAPSPTEAEQQRIEQRIAQRDVSPSAMAQPASIFTAPGPMTFIAMTPCRVMDTRAGQGFTGAFGPPSLAAFGTARQVPMPSSSTCTISSNAGAYSLNITAVSPGALSFLSVWPAGQPYPGVSTLNDSSPTGGAVANAAIVPAGTAGAIQMVAGNITDVIIDINGYYAAPTDVNSNTAIGAGTLASNTSGYNNTASGSGALNSNTTGYQNTASGEGALGSNSTGSNNTASGASALLHNTTGSQNTASGTSALLTNTTGQDNTANGSGALYSNTAGNFNTASGYDALFSNTTASSNTASGYAALQSNVTGSDNTASGFAALTSNTTGADNAASGALALQSNTTGSNNTASGWSALGANTTGINNTASGWSALAQNTTGSSNTASGQAALGANTTGTYNTASGAGAMFLNTIGSHNTADGISALYYNTSGNNNTASGVAALQNNTTGSNNIAMGYNAAFNVSAVNSNNIHIGSEGASGDSAVIRIGTEGTQTIAYIAGIYGESSTADNLLVCIDSTGKLGTLGCNGTASSRRFKEQIADMGDSSSKLFQLRPVTFFYKPQYDDGSHALQYGLIAEEVAKLYPEMVGYDKDGQPSSVKYQSLAPMLLNEVQKQNAQIQSQAEAIQLQQEQNRKLEDRLAALEALLSSQTSTATRPASSQ